MSIFIDRLLFIYWSFWITLLIILTMFCVVIFVSFRMPYLIIKDLLKLGFNNYWRKR